MGERKELNPLISRLLFWGGVHIKKKKTTWAIGQVALGFTLILFLVSAVYLDKLISLFH